MSFIFGVLMFCWGLALLGGIIHLIWDKGVRYFNEDLPAFLE